MKLQAFYRLLKDFPTPLVPLFRDSSGQYFAQDIDLDGIVTDFIPLKGSETSRLLIENVPDTSPQVVGGSATYAFALSKNHIIAGHKDTFRASISDNYEKLDKYSNPFSLLDMAILVGDTNLILGAALACKKRLDSTFPDLTAKWIAGAPLNPDVKSLLYTANPAPAAAPDILPTSIRYGFSGPWILMTGVTRFCFSKGRYRADVLRGFFESENYISDTRGIISSVRPALRLITDVMNNANSLRPYMREQSRGRINMIVPNIKSYYGFRQTFRKELQSSRKYSEYHLSRYYNGGDEHMSFLIVFSYLTSAFTDFPEFIKEYAGSNPLQMELDMDALSERDDRG